MDTSKKPRELPKRPAQPDVYQSTVMKKSRRCAHTLPLEGKSEILSDVQGSYTGLDIDGGKPVQDADDL